MILKTDLNSVKRIARHKRKRVKEMLSNGKNIYKNIKEHENEINYDLYDLTQKETGFKRLVFVLNILYPGKIGRDFKMTTGHSHKHQDEFYLFIRGSGKMVLIDPKKKKYVFKVKPNDLIIVPGGYWHRVINTGNKKMVFLNFFEGKLPFSRK